MWIDLAMYQVGASFVGEGLLDFAFNGRRARRMGNRHETMAPHGCYPCLGKDQWLVLAARDDADWQALCEALGTPNLAADPRFANPVERHRNQDALDAIISGWTSGRAKYDAMRELQAAGVPAGPALDGRDLWRDPHLRRTGLLRGGGAPPRHGTGPTRIRESGLANVRESGTHPQAGSHAWRGQQVRVVPGDRVERRQNRRTGSRRRGGATLDRRSTAGCGSAGTAGRTGAGQWITTPIIESVNATRRQRRMPQHRHGLGSARNNAPHCHREERLHYLSSRGAPPPPVIARSVATRRSRCLGERPSGQ